MIVTDTPISLSFPDAAIYNILFFFFYRRRHAVARVTVYSERTFIICNVANGIHSTDAYCGVSLLVISHREFCMVFHWHTMVCLLFGVV